MASLTDWAQLDDGAALVIWGNAEVATTIMAASIPILRALFSREAYRNRY